MQKVIKQYDANYLKNTFTKECIHFFSSQGIQEMIKSKIVVNFCDVNKFCLANESYFDHLQISEMIFRAVDSCQAFQLLNLMNPLCIVRENLNFRGNNYSGK